MGNAGVLFIALPKGCIEESLPLLRERVHRLLIDRLLKHLRATEKRGTFSALQRLKQIARAQHRNRMPTISPLYHENLQLTISNSHTSISFSGLSMLQAKGSLSDPDWIS